MNADISYNTRVANQAALEKGRFHKALNKLAGQLGVDLSEAAEPEPKLSENNSWIASAANKVELIADTVEPDKAGFDRSE